MIGFFVVIIGVSLSLEEYMSAADIEVIGIIITIMIAIIKFFIFFDLKIKEYCINLKLDISIRNIEVYLSRVLWVANNNFLHNMDSVFIE